MIFGTPRQDKPTNTEAISDFLPQTNDSSAIF